MWFSYRRGCKIQCFQLLYTTMKTNKKYTRKSIQKSHKIDARTLSKTACQKHNQKISKKSLEVRKMVSQGGRYRGGKTQYFDTFSLPGAKMAPRPPKMAPRSPQDAPKMLPRPPPRPSQDSPQDLPMDLKDSPQDLPRDLQGTLKSTLKLTKKNAGVSTI